MWMDLWRLLTEWIRANPELIAAFVVGVVATIVVGLFSWWWLRKPRLDDSHLALRFRVGDLERENTELRQQAADLRAENRRLRESEAGLRQEAAKLRETLQAREREIEQMKGELQESRLELERNSRFVDRHLATARDLTEQLEALKTQHHEAVEQFRSEMQRLKQERDQFKQQLEARISLEEFDGRIWQSRRLAPSPGFVPRESRKTRIIAVVNLKGGVGKTTLTAFIGAALWERGKRVLLLDLDYQGSLSLLCLGADYSEALEKRRLIDNFLQLRSPSFAQLRDRAISSRVLGKETGGRYDVVAADDTLQRTEGALLSRWLGGRSEMDVRLILRQALHDPQADQEYDFVLLDCPPRLSTACINALCCCDYVVIPTRLDRLSADGVYRVLRTLRIMATGDEKTEDGAIGKLPKICPHMHVLAVVPNFVRRWRQQPIRAQQHILDELPQQCIAAWGKEVSVIKEGIPENADFSRACLDAFSSRSSTLGDYFRNITNTLLLKIAESERERRSVAVVS